MNTSTKLIIAAGAGFGAFFLYKKLKEKSDENKAENAKRIEEEAKSASENEKKQSSDLSKPSTGVSPYKQKVMILQELLKVGVDGSAGKQTLGQLEYMWADYGLPFNPEQSAKDGYPNLKKNGKGVLSASNIDYYIDTLKASKSPRSLYWTKKVSSVVQTTEVIARLARGKKLYDLGAKGRRIAVARPYFVTTRRFESSSGLYLNDSDSGHTFNPSDKHLFSDWTKESNSAEGYWILKRKANPKQFVIVDPLKFTDY